MKEQEYYQEIESYIKRNETNKKVRLLEENFDTLNNYWNIGKLLVEAQGGEKRAKYGNKLIKKWSMEFTRNYGKGYNKSNLFKFRQFYLCMSNVSTVSRQLTWSHIVELLPIKEINKRNYYINEIISKKLSIRNLREAIKSNSYERLVNKPDKIEIVNTSNNISFLDNMKNPIIIKVDKNIKKSTQNKTLGIIISKEQDNFIANFVRSEVLVPLTYRLT